jgi:hypothetical protein
MHIPLVDCKPLYWLLWPSVQLSVRTSDTVVFYLWWLLGYLFHKHALMMTTTPLFSSLSTSWARFSTQLFLCLF